jgi:3-methyladenine DNA glycosylase AlkD
MKKYIAMHAASKEFFHQKAIGWALRQYGKTNPDAVIKFVENAPMANLSKREAMKHLG